MKNKKRRKELFPLYLLWGTQTFSALGSAMTSYALVIWSYAQTGQALSTALLMVCSYAPYVLMSIFAGALSDRWDKRRTMIVCDLLAVFSTGLIGLLLAAGRLQIWHLYLLNAFSGLMGTVQQPASEVAVTLLTPRDFYQKISALRSFSGSLNSLLTPALATVLLAFGGMGLVISFDVLTCLIAVGALVLKIRLPRQEMTGEEKQPLLKSAGEGLTYLRENRGILHMILFLAAINLVASAYNAALPALVLSRENGGETVLGWVNTCAGLAMLVGSMVVTLLPEPKSRARVVCNSLLFSMSFENFCLAFGQESWIWCVGAVLGWLCIPLMSTNLEALLRSHIPAGIQGRVYAARNTLQFFTIPVGYLLGGALVDQVCEPFMATQPAGSPLTALFGTGKGSGAAFLFLLLAVSGILVCLLFRRNRHIRSLF